MEHGRIAPLNLSPSPSIITIKKISTEKGDSPVFSYINNLSPLQPVKAAPIAQGFPGLSSPSTETGIFSSPRVKLQTSFLNRQLQSPVSNTDFSEDSDKCQRKDVHYDNSAKIDLESGSPSISGYPTGCNRKNVVQVAQHSAPGYPDEFLAKPRECVVTNSLNKIQFVDSPRSSEGGSSVQKDNITFEDMPLDGTSFTEVTENAQPKLTGNSKCEKHSNCLLPASSKCFSIFSKLSPGQTSEASHIESGSLRRCLFDENQSEYTIDVSDSQNPSHNIASIQEVVNSSSPETTEGRQMISLSKPLTTGCAHSTAGKYPVSLAKPLGIGLHLNSVVYPRSMDNATTDKESRQKVVRVMGKTSVLVASNQSAGKVNASSIPTNFAGQVPACFDESETHQNEASLLATPGNSLGLDAEEHLQDSMSMLVDPSAMVGDKRKFNSEPAEAVQTFNPGSPKTKRKKSSSTPDDSTSKRCNCKRSKCLKLYCDCFAAGLYCAESCACQGCSNRLEYEDTVLEARQQITTRNPLAFAPKVVKPVADSPAASVKEVGNLSTPASARHKRGCNCKRSMCVKKYCECYQSNVGCSDGCRCEGCKNVFGKREDHSFSRELMVNKVGNEMPGALLDESRLRNSPHVTPMTPALQCSDQKKISRLPVRRFLQCPGSDQHTIPLPSDEISSFPINSPNDSTFVEETERSTDIPPPSSNLRWRSSPVTPITESSRSEYLENFVDSGNKDPHVFEDETPEILKDSANSSRDSVKVRSPNKKRVSPPHHHTHNSSSESLKVCHKYVLRALPSFPQVFPKIWQ